MPIILNPLSLKPHRKFSYMRGCDIVPGKKTMVGLLLSVYQIESVIGTLFEEIPTSL
ncbi:TPA: hypothetical protein KRI64_004154, partial [Clostridioides difficile]|nr:hypothetical protein [Clostridioides difficile]HBG8866817.1 hypothetical protein [Clostridioides difficile]HBG8933111.1 hypothetical protein [Clostridioides difficile]HBG9042271.1 hypothetical protein [Clostridioides difficile]